MNTTKTLAGCVAVLASLSAAWAQAGPQQQAAICLAGSAALGQSAGAKSNNNDDRQKVDILLQRARTAMRDKHYEMADALITRAEAMNVEFGLLHLGDTPKKARRDLDTKRALHGNVKRPSEQVQPMNADPQGETAAAKQPERKLRPLTSSTNPEGIDQHDAADAVASGPKPDESIERSSFARRSSIAPPADDSADTDLPTRVTSGVAPAAPAANDSPETRRRSDGLLLGARRAMAAGDARQAASLVEQAQALGVPYGLHDDSPAKVDAAIRKHNEVFTGANSRLETDGLRRQKAEVLLDEAQQLMRWKDLDGAERLANEAARMKINLGSDSRPEALLQRIAAQRGGAAPAPTAPRQPVNVLQQMAADRRDIAARATSRPDREAAAPREAPPREAAPRSASDKQFAGGDEAEASNLQVRGGGPSFETVSPVERHDDYSVDRAVVAAGGALSPATQYPTTKAVYDPNRDPTRNLAAGGSLRQPNRLADRDSAEPIDRLPPATIDRLPPAPQEDSTSTPKSISDADRLFEQGEQALRSRNKDQALKLFRQAYTLRDQLDPRIAQRLQDHLQLLSAPTNLRTPQKSESLIEGATAQQKLLAKQVSAEVARQTEAANAMKAKDPKGAVELLKKARESVESSGIEPQFRAALITRVDRALAELDKYVSENRAQIELDDRNRTILADVDRRRKNKVEVDNKLAKLVEDYNRLIEEHRWEEAELKAKKARELDPDSTLVVQLVRESGLIRALQNQIASKERREEGFITVLDNVEKSAEPYDDMKPYQFGDAKHWNEMTSIRSKYGKQRQRLNEKELEIKQKLSTPVTARFHERPLSEVLDQLSKLAGVNLHLDSRGLAQEGVASDTPVTIDLNQDISLKSALMLILEPLNLSYVIKNEVLNITSEQLRDGDVYTVTYNVADLVIPIPNFVPSSGMGLSGALQDAHARLGIGQPGGFGQPTAVVASRDGSNANGVIDPTVLAQMQRFNPGGHSGPVSGTPQAIGNGFGPGGMGGGVQADFESLIDLITSTVAPQTWDDVGGQGAIAQFQTNLSLVISQTQEVHEQIVDLLEQLRRLQDLQVTIEVRFITLNDNFFERIGVDFQFNIEDKVTTDPTKDVKTPSLTIGLDNTATQGGGLPAFSSDKDIQFRQGSFGLAIPQFGGFDAASSALSAGRFGFAILSDIEAYFLINAAQGDKRSNVLQAPKVTLFNGQQAFVSDTTQQPFVISVIPVVGDFAAAQQPVIVVLSEGTFLTVQAVISNDRRFVRLTVVPFFSQIGKVDQFTFSGSKTTTKNTSNSSGKTAGGDDTASNADNSTTTTEGVTIQLPTFSFVTVTTTVSVPDGGTVLLGGIKRLSEGRNEFGVPILSKLPYINRLFKNVGIGRDTQSLMMMVTPRIIIQEEEEAALGIQAP